MARCRCRTLLWLCLPFVLSGLFFVYFTITVCQVMSHSRHHGGRASATHFIAPGAFNSGALASRPVGPFWDLRPDRGAFWNGLQVLSDRRRNPILRGPRALERDAEENAPPRTGAACGRDRGLISRLPDFETWPEQMQEFALSMHCREYPLLQNQPYACGSDGTEAPMLLMAIKSQEGNFESRQAIRQTWGRDGWVTGLNGTGGGVVRRVFLLGRQDASAGPYADVADLLEREKAGFRDILQWDFQDTFFNLTLKDVLFWHWFSRHCPRARFVFKGDDDVFVRTPALLDTLGRAERAMRPGTKWKMRDFIVGDVIRNALPLKETTNKYYIPETFYKGAYPPYAGGGGVVYSGALVLRLKRVSKRVHLFPIDDVYLGMCLQRLGVYPIHHYGFLTFDFPDGEAKKPCAYHTILLVHKRTPKEILKLWQGQKVAHPECANKTLGFTQAPTRAKPDPVTSNLEPLKDTISLLFLLNF